MSRETPENMHKKKQQQQLPKTCQQAIMKKKRGISPTGPGCCASIRLGAFAPLFGLCHRLRQGLVCFLVLYSSFPSNTQTMVCTFSPFFHLHNHHVLLPSPFKNSSLNLVLCLLLPALACMHVTGAPTTVMAHSSTQQTSPPFFLPSASPSFL